MSSKIIEALKTIDWKDVAVRAGWTLVQTMLAVLLLMSEQIISLIFAGDWVALKSLAVATVIGMVAAGLSALKGIIIGVIKDIKLKNS